MTTQVKVLIIAALMLLAFVVMPTLVWADQADASQAISSAKQDLLGCYSAAKAAEAAGANITKLTATLNEAGSFIDHAECAYSAGDFNAAANYARGGQGKLSGFISEAEKLKGSAAQQGSLDFWVYTVGSIVGSIAIVGVSIGIWFWNTHKVGEQVNGGASEV